MKSIARRLFTLIAAPVLVIPIAWGVSTPATAAPVACDNSVQEYFVAAGDTLSRISGAAFGDPQQWPRIFEYPGNSDVIGRNPNLLIIGTPLRIPPCPGSVQSIPKQVAPEKKTARTASNKIPFKIYVVTGDDWPPYVSTDWPNGGMATVIVEAAFEAAGMSDDVEIHYVNDWSAQLETLTKTNRYQLTFPWYYPKMDFWQTCDRLPKPMQIRCEYAHSNPIANVTLAFFKESGRANLSGETIESMNTKRLCRPKGYSTFELVENGITVDNLHIEDSPKDCYQRLLEGAVDYVLLNRFTGLAVAAEMGIGDRVEMAPISIASPIHILAYKNNPLETVQILDDFNVGLEKIIDNGTYGQIISYFNDEFTRRLAKQ
ncbi:MAG: transporter substrate-binding domain-containing protein [Hyphomicrobiales bacterium]|nr:transporter substrate-binding domain-containing protein [Hyphomicrobiales bacterium]MCP4998993.1 transporter substrate-binding domain-containing protein [Hyphomicrobiales bacterium]